MNYTVQAADVFMAGAITCKILSPPSIKGPWHGKTYQKSLRNSWTEEGNLYCPV